MTCFALAVCSRVDRFDLEVKQGHYNVMDDPFLNDK